MALLPAVLISPSPLPSPCSLVDESGQRSERLDEWRSYLQFLQDCEDEEAWLVEKQRICTAGITAKDLRAVLAMQQKHKVRRQTVSLSSACVWCSYFSTTQVHKHGI